MCFIQSDRKSARILPSWVYNWFEQNKKKNKNNNQKTDWDKSAT